jgi:hypothetical protein
MKDKELAQTSQIIGLEYNQTRNDSRLPGDVEGRLESFSTYIESRLDFAKWLHGLESSDSLLALEAKTSRNISWCKGVLARWKSSGYPNPESWPEIQSSPWLHPSYSLNNKDWPSI